MPSKVTMFVALATTPKSAVFVIGAPKILRAISVAGTVQTLPLVTLKVFFQNRWFLI